MLLNDGSKHVNVVGWRKNPTLSARVETSRRRSRRCLLMSLALAKTSAQQVLHGAFLNFLFLDENSCYIGVVNLFGSFKMGNYKKSEV